MKAELTRRVAAESGRDREIAVEATEAERAAVASRLGLPAVLSLACLYRLRAGERVIPVTGRLSARVRQTCVVTLDEFEAAIEEQFHVRFVPEGSESGEIDPDDDDEIPYAGGALDLGEATVEQLALALDPYPHRPGAELPPEARDAGANPFLVLARRKPRG